MWAFNYIITCGWSFLNLLWSRAPLPLKASPSGKYLHRTPAQWTYLCLQVLLCLKLPSLFAGWLLSMFHTKSLNTKAFVILSHSWSPFLPLTCLYGTKWTFVGLCSVFWRIFLRKNSPQITHVNHMTVTTSGQI